MPAEVERIFPIAGFKGLNQKLIPGTSTQFTRDLDNVKVRYGRVFGRGGIEKFRGIATQASENILRLMPYTGNDLSVTLTRLLLTKFEWLNTGTDTWTDATGTALTGAGTERPQFVTHKGVLIFTNEGADRPRKWTGTGNSAVLGGTPPFCKAIADYVNFLFLINVSDDGTTFIPKEVRYSDDYDVDWSLCEGNTLTLLTTEGRAAGVLARLLLVYTATHVETIRFVGGQVRFAQEVIPFDKGIVAPLSLGICGEAGHIFLATDYELYQVTQSTVRPLPPFVQDKLHTTMDLNQVGDVFSVVMPDEETYYLFYPTQTTDTYNRGRIAYNYRTGEFHHSTYAGHQFLSGLAFQFDHTSAGQLIAADTNKRVMELDTIDTNTDDDGTAVSRYYETDWHALNHGAPKYLKGATLAFKRQAGARVKISVAADYKETFVYPKIFDLRGKPGESDVIIDYNIPQPFEGTFFNLRIDFYHDAVNAVGELHNIFLRWVPSTHESDVRDVSQGPTY